MASQDFPLIPDPHAPTHLPQTSDSTTTNEDYFANPTFTPTPTEDSDPDRSGSGSGSKRNPYYYKKQKTGNNSGSGSGGNNNNSETASEYRVDYRKDREEWSDTAIACLLEAYTEKFNQLNRGNLRGRDWEEVAEAVTERCGGGSYNGDNSNDKQQQKAWKSVEQCKNKIDNLKKRYKVELQRLNSSGGGNSNWHWFKQLEVIVGSNNSSNLVTKSASSGGSASAAAGGIETVKRNAGGGAEAISSPFTRQSKRYTPSGVPITNLKPKPQQSLKWQRVVFKISGSALAGAGLAGNCQNVDAKIAGEVATACRLGVQVAIVVGGRNFFCGDSWVSATSLDRPTAYQIGMTATVMNALLLQSALEKVYVQTRVQSAFSLPEFVEPYSRQRAIRHLEKGRVVIFGGIGAGTGNPLFTTDTAAALRASEINADVVLKGTNVSGVCDYQNRKFEHICFRDVVSGSFTPMDAMALTYCEENRIPVVVFNLLETGNVSKALCGDPVGTLIDLEGRTD